MAGLLAVLQQVTHGIVVLAVRQAPQHDLWGDTISARLLLPVPKRVANSGPARVGQVANPGFQRHFLRTAFDGCARHRCAACAGSASRSRIEFAGILPVDKFRQGFAEGVNPGWAASSDREMQPRGGCNSFHVVAVSAACVSPESGRPFARRKLAGREARPQ